MALTDKLTAIANSIRAKTGGTATMTLAEMPTEIASIQTGITPSGSITLTSENTYDVTSKASAVVDFSATRANLAEAVTAKGVDTLPTSSFDTIATNIGLISGGGIDSNRFKVGVLEINTDTQSITIPHGFGSEPTKYGFVNFGDMSTTREVEAGIVYKNIFTSLYRRDPNGTVGTETVRYITVDDTNMTIDCTKAGATYQIFAGSTILWWAGE